MTLKDEIQNFLRTPNRKKLYIQGIECYDFCYYRTYLIQRQENHNYLVFERMSKHGVWALIRKCNIHNLLRLITKRIIMSSAIFIPFDANERLSIFDKVDNIDIISPLGERTQCVSPTLVSDVKNMLILFKFFSPYHNKEFIMLNKNYYVDKFKKTSSTINYSISDKILSFDDILGFIENEDYISLKNIIVSIK